MMAEDSYYAFTFFQNPWTEDIYEFNWRGNVMYQNLQTKITLNLNQTKLFYQSNASSLIRLTKCVKTFLTDKFSRNLVKLHNRRVTWRYATCKKCSIETTFFSCGYSLSEKCIEFHDKRQWAYKTLLLWNINEIFHRRNKQNRKNRGWMQRFFQFWKNVFHSWMHILHV